METWKRDTEEEREEPAEKKGWLRSLSRLGRKKELLLLGLAVFGMAALMWPETKEAAFGTPGAEMPARMSNRAEDVRQQLTQEEQQILEQIAGIGKVDVCLTLDSDGVREYALNQAEEKTESVEPSQQGSGMREEKKETLQTDVAVFGGDALLVESRAPKVVGVLVVAQGAENVVIQQKICDAVAVLLDISPHRVRVLAGQEEKIQ